MHKLRSLSGSTGIRELPVSPADGAALRLQRPSLSLCATQTVSAARGQSSRWQKPVYASCASQQSVAAAGCHRCRRRSQRQRQQHAGPPNSRAAAGTQCPAACSTGRQQVSPCKHIDRSARADQLHGSSMLAGVGQVRALDLPHVCRARLIVAELAGSSGRSGGPAAGVVPAATSGAASLRDKATAAFPPPPVACSGAQPTRHVPVPAFGTQRMWNGSNAVCQPQQGNRQALASANRPTAAMPPSAEEQPVWTDQVWASPLDIRRRVFCNRSLNMKSISAVGVSWRQRAWVRGTACCSVSLTCRAVADNTTPLPAPCPMHSLRPPHSTV